MKRIFTSKIVLALLLSIASRSALAAPPVDWVVNDANFQFSMNIIAVIETSCIESTNPNNLLAAFVGTECRGVQAADVKAGARQLAYLFVYSNQVSGETISFKVYDADHDIVLDVPATMAFVYDGVVGGNTTPYIAKSNDAPTGITLSATSISDTSAIGAVIGTFTSTDANTSDTHTYTLATGTGDADNSSFTISANQLKLNTALNYSVKNSYAIRVRTTDDKYCSYDKAYTITVIDNNYLAIHRDILSPEGALYPNPAENTITISYAGELVLYDTKGVEVLHEYVPSGESRSVEALEPGIYYYTIDHRVAGKVVIR